MAKDDESENVAVRLCLDARDPITCNQHTHKNYIICMIETNTESIINIRNLNDLNNGDMRGHLT